MQYTGNPVSGGIAIGRILRYIPYSPVVNQNNISKDEVTPALDRLQTAKNSARSELEAICAAMRENDPDKAKIFTAHIDILMDPSIDEEIQDKITEDLMDVEWSIDKIFGKYIRIMQKKTDAIMRERAADLNDVRTRLLRNCAGIKESNLSHLPRSVVIATHDLFPSDTASMDRENVLGIVTEVGGSTSHTAIIARSYGIPALLGVADVLNSVTDGQEVILDAVGGSLICDPSETQKHEYSAKLEKYKKHVAETAKYIDKNPVTTDGVTVEVHLNIGSADPGELEPNKYTDGVGLFRTEFLYMCSNRLPDEDEQCAMYRKVLLKFGNRPVIMRTLDIGGDKQLEALPLPSEQNPFLGNRALRLCFSKPELFHTQLRAALRASVDGNLWIMFPMVGSLDDLRRAKQALQRAKDELTAQNIAFKPDIKVGVMIEIPSIALIADHVAKEADFASIGTNDLCQYATAVDRMNPTVAEYYQSYHPAMFRLIRNVVEQFAIAGKPVGVCGEMGGDPLAIPVLLGLGMRKISMNASSVAQCKKIITHLDIPRAEKLAERVCEMGTAREIEEYLKSELSELL